MKKKKDIIIIIVFISFLFLPSISYWFLKDKMDSANYENRDLYLKPELTFKSILTFPRDFENYYNDNLPFKNEIRKIRANAYYSLFNLSTTSRVIVGEDGWLFYNAEEALDGTTISDYQKKLQYTIDEKEKIKNKIIEYKNRLNNIRNVQTYILIIPNKENVYSNKLENVIVKSNNKYSKTEDLINYINGNSNLKILYPKEELNSNKKISDTYLKYDTHWNDFGAYIGVVKFLKEYDKEFIEPEINITKQKKNGDLAIMNLTQNLKNDEPIVNNFYDDIKYECVEISEIEYCNSAKPLYDKTILVVGDSFRTAMIPYISKLYKKSIFVHRKIYNDSLVINNNVNIVLYELVERYSTVLNEL